MADRNQGTLHALVLVVLVITITSAVVAMYWMSRTSSKTAIEDGGNRAYFKSSGRNSSLCDKSETVCDDDTATVTLPMLFQWNPLNWQLDAEAEVAE